MIIWGARSNTIDLGAIETKACPTCEKERTHRLILQYRYAHLYYIFGAVTKKQYICACEICGRGPALNSKEVESTLKKKPIPFIHRLGWTILIGLIAFVVGVTVFTSQL